MNRIKETFSARKAQGQKTLLAYLCMGDPSLEESIELAIATAEAGADILELGVPFSDPTADGPRIARASQRAIEHGATLPRILEAAARIRARTEAPLVLFTYYNPVLVIGEAQTLALAKSAGIDALLIVDLPPEEARPLRKASASLGLPLVPLVAPTTTPERVDYITSETKAPDTPSSFLYYVSMTGVTGAAAADFSRARAEAQALRKRTDLPVVIGFGIDGPKTAREAAGGAQDGPDGIVVGTAIVKRIEEGSTAEARKESVCAFVKALRAELDDAFPQSPTRSL